MMNKIRSILFLALVLSNTYLISAQHVYELNSNWYCSPVSQTKESGEIISGQNYKINNWLPATVPGTVLTTMLNNKLIPDPFYGMNNKYIPDIYFTGREYYTYWFVNDFEEKVNTGEVVWLNLRGINYSCDIYLNGKKVNTDTHYGMFLRQCYNVTSFLSGNGKNRLAVIVYPIDPVGNPNGGQGGDGVIARNVSHQYVAGWDWIQPIRDRNTGIWDKVIIEKTGPVNLKNPHIITVVPGVRFPGKVQAEAYVKTSVEIENPGKSIIKGTIQFTIDGKLIKKVVSINPNSTIVASLPDIKIENPKLWWPNGYGEQYLYDSKFQFIGKDNKISDEEQQKVGIRDIKTVWSEKTQSAQLTVNGQKIFIRGGNWIISDAMLRLTNERYDAEIRFHRDMNLNLIRIWGGALLERPEFYDACDKYGLLVFQDLWASGDCNGKWLDPMKKEDQWTRRQYPDDHNLFIKSVADQVKMVRNHPSLAVWCGGNEITPAEDILKELQDSIFTFIDSTHYFFPYSNSPEMSVNTIGGNGDGPYTIQPISTFWENRTFPFNSEVGSVGTGDYESLKRFIPKENMIAPDYVNNKIDSVWDYHKDIGYATFIDQYGKPSDIKDFANKAQLVNYNQYRALIEGFSSHAWDWYTGLIIWKTQNPWTALRGQMYDYYLDPNACLYALRNAGEPLHVMCNPVDGMIMIANNTFETVRDMMVQVKVFDTNWDQLMFDQMIVEIAPSFSQKYFSIKKGLDKIVNDKGLFVLTRLFDAKGNLKSDNLYWLPNTNGNFIGLQTMNKVKPKIKAKKIRNGQIEVSIDNQNNNLLAFFNRISLENPSTGQRILPVFYSNNYISVLPGEVKHVILDYNPSQNNEEPIVSVYGWNVEKQLINIE